MYHLTFFSFLTFFSTLFLLLFLIFTHFFLPFLKCLFFICVYALVPSLSLSFFHLLLSVAHVPLDYNGCSTTTAADYSHIQACPWYGLLCTWLMGALFLTDGSPFLLSILCLHMRVSLVFLHRPLTTLFCI